MVLYITVCCDNVEEQRVILEKEDSVDYLRQCVANNFSIPLNYISMKYNGILLNDNKQLLDYNMSEESIVKVFY